MHNDDILYKCDFIMKFLVSIDEQSFSNLEELLFATNQHACFQGYAVITKRTKKNKKDSVRKAGLRCDKEFKYKPKNFDKRQFFIRQTKCPFSLIVTRDAEFDVGVLIVDNPVHNHKPTIKKSHPMHRKNAMTKNVKNIVVAFIRTNSNTKQIFFILRLKGDEKNPIVKSRDIYNLRAQQKRKELNSYSVIQTLMLKLNKRNNLYMKHTANEHEKIIRLFFTKTSAKKILKLNHEILLMNCTYKTNIYYMSLCIINRVTLMNITFYVGFCFLFKKKTENYK